MARCRGWDSFVAATICHAPELHDVPMNVCDSANRAVVHETTSNVAPRNTTCGQAGQVVWRLPAYTADTGNDTSGFLEIALFMSQQQNAICLLLR